MSELWRIVAWLAGGAVLSLLVAWVAVAVQRAGFAPSLAMPIVVGAVFGALLAVWSRLSGVKMQRLLILGAVVLAQAVTLGQHYFFYRAYKLQYEQAREQKPALAMAGEKFQPPGFVEFLRHSAETDKQVLPGVAVPAPVQWSLEAVLLTVAGVAASLVVKNKVDRNEALAV